MVSSALIAFPRLFLTPHCLRQFSYTNYFLSYKVCCDCSTESSLYPCFKVIIQACTFAQYHIQRHVVFPSRLFDAHNQAIEYLWQAFYNAIDLAAAHANALTVDSRVRTTINDGASPGCNLDPVTMSPHTWIHIEVAIV